MAQVEIGNRATALSDERRLRRKSNARRGFRTSLVSWVYRFRANVKKVAAEVLSDSCDSEYGKRTLDALFDEKTERGSEKAWGTESDERGRDRSLTVTLDSYDRSAMSSKKTSIASESEWTFDTFDPLQQCDRLRSLSNEPFVDGPKIWEVRRKLWNTRTETNTFKEAAQHRADFQKIQAQYYIRIYTKLVLDDQKLVQPVNLQDVMKIIDAGWFEMNKWERAAKGIA